MINFKYLFTKVRQRGGLSYIQAVIGRPYKLSIRNTCGVLRGFFNT